MTWSDVRINNVCEEDSKKSFEGRASPPCTPGLPIQNNALVARKADIKTFVNVNGGSLIALGQSR